MTRKRILIIALIALALLLVAYVFYRYLIWECSGDLRGKLNHVTKIEIGTGFRFQMPDGTVKDERKLLQIITNPRKINAFISELSFGGERNFTVKHRLPGFVGFYSDDNLIAHLRFEGRITRYNNREYSLSTKTQRMLRDFFKR